MIRKFAALLLIITSTFLFSQNRIETGRPFITTYNPVELGGDLQTWAFVQDQRGVMYAGNQPGVLEFDGASWRMLSTANNSFVRSLDIDDNGRIYVGAQSDFGYLAPDRKGELQFVSLLDNITNEDDKRFGYVWTTHVTPKGVYFQTNERIFRFKPISATPPLSMESKKDSLAWEIKIWSPENKFNYAFWLDDTYYVQQSGAGLTHMMDDSLYAIPGGSQFGGERLQVMLPYGAGLKKEKGKYILGTFSRGLFLYDQNRDSNRFTAFKTMADNFLKTNTLYDGAVLSDGSYGLATINGGFVAIDHEGNDQVYLQDLSSNSILSIYVDRDGHVWLGPESGISIVEIPSPLTLYDNSNGVDGSVYDIFRHKGTIYIGTSTGVYYLDSDDSFFKPVTGLEPGNHQTFRLKSVHDDLLLAVGTGLHKLKNKTTASVIKKSTALSFLVQDLHQSKQDPNRIFVGLFDGVASARFDINSNRWVYEGRIAGIAEYVTTITEVEPGVLWIGTNARGLFRVQIKDNSLKAAKVENFGPEDGLPDGGVRTMLAFGKAYFVTSDGVRRYDDETRRFIPDSTFNVVGFSNTAINYQGVLEDYAGNAWINFGKETAVMLKQPGGSYKTERMAFQRFSDKPVTVIYPEKNGVVWFGISDGLIRYDPSVKKDYDLSYQALIRRVTANEDSVIYGGAGNIPLNPPSKGDLERGVSLPFANNALRFEFSAPAYDNPRGNQYQTILEGFDERWSHWSKENFRTYTNLPHGNYKFKVHAKNIYQHISSEAVYEFSILPPWYRTWWAYGGYAFILVLGLFAVDRAQRRRLVKRERQRAELLSKIGKDITGSLDSDTIFYKLYENVNQIIDASIFGVGIYHADKNQIEYRLAIENGKKYEPYTRDTNDKNQFPVWCVENRQPVFINDVHEEYSNYLSKYVDVASRLEDGTLSEEPQSLIYLPLVAKEKVLGVITVQSFQKNAYHTFHLSILQNLAAYTTIALDNANAYRQLNDVLENLEKTVEERTAEIHTQKENVELLSEIGKEITASLDMDTIFFKLYEHVNQLADATIFGVGIYHPEKQEIEYRLAIEKGKKYEPYSRDTTNKNQFPVWCIENRKPVFINDVEKEFKQYLKDYKTDSDAGRRLEDGTVSGVPYSIIYLPLLTQERVLGVITIQSYKKNAYTNYHLNLLQNLATYTTIAFDNADAYRKLNQTLENLKSTQEKLVTQEKLASLGALTAGIAHEIKNPLNFVNNFAELSIELVAELRGQIGNRKAKIGKREEIDAIINDLQQNARKINEHGKRADSIVRSMLQHSRGSKGERQETDINAMLDEDLNLAYHGMRAQDSSFNITIEKDFDAKLGKIEIVPQDISRVFLNIISNGFYAAHLKTRGREGKRVRGRAEDNQLPTHPFSPSPTPTFRPTLKVSTRAAGDKIEIRIRDNGNGIPAEIREKIFNPFFTTKPTGQGTGLGLSISYDIVVQEHRGEIQVKTEEGRFTEFVIVLPNPGRPEPNIEAAGIY